MHCVDLGESFQTQIFLQNLASIKPRTSPQKFARSPNECSSPGSFVALSHLVPVQGVVEARVEEGSDAPEADVGALLVATELCVSSVNLCSFSLVPPSKWAALI